MTIGIVADTHDNLARIDQAVAFLNERRVQLVLHAGDIVAPFAMLRFGMLTCRLVAVFGNNDGEHEGLCRTCNTFQATIHEPPYVLQLAGRSILMVHDIDMISPKNRGEYDIIVCGHTHHAKLEQEHDTLILNPGECGGWISGIATLALLDVAGATAQIHTLD